MIATDGLLCDMGEEGRKVISFTSKMIVGDGVIEDAEEVLELRSEGEDEGRGGVEERSVGEERGSVERVKEGEGVIVGEDCGKG